MPEADVSQLRPTRISVCRHPAPPVMPCTTTVVDYSYIVQITGRIQNAKDLHEKIPQWVSEATVHAVSDLICYEPNPPAGQKERPKCVQSISSGDFDEYVDQNCQIGQEADACARYNGEIQVVHTKACKKEDLDEEIYDCLVGDAAVRYDVHDWLDERKDTPNGVPIYLRKPPSSGVVENEISGGHDGLAVTDVAFGPTIVAGEGGGDGDGSGGGGGYVPLPGGGGGEGEGGGTGGDGYGDGTNGSGGENGSNERDPPYIAPIVNQEGPTAVEKDGLTAGGKTVASLMGLLFLLLLLLCCCAWRRGIFSRRRRRTADVSGLNDSENNNNNKAMEVENDWEGLLESSNSNSNGDLADADMAGNVGNGDGYQEADFNQPGQRHSKLDVHKCQSVTCEACRPSIINPNSSIADGASSTMSFLPASEAAQSPAQLRRMGRKHIKEARNAAKNAPPPAVVSLPLMSTTRSTATTSADGTGDPPCEHKPGDKSYLNCPCCNPDNICS